MDNVDSSYDRVPYESYPYAETHPDHLATVAQLFGLDSPDPDGCRVLELGCGAGGNLIPMAVAMPGATFLGIDLSQRQIDDGLELARRLELSNLDLQRRDIRSVGPADGTFDYIICHGVYSWASSDVQRSILEICRDHLASNGVAYVSYNTYPGWFLRGMVRRMVGFHARQFDDPGIQVRQARALLDFLIDMTSDHDELYHVLLQRELEMIRDRHDSYVFHEHLEDVNEPVFFYEFMERAEANGLRYLGEAQFSEMLAANVSPRIDAALRELGGDLVHSEQYLDFVRNRTFRRTLLCRRERSLQRNVGPGRLAQWEASGSFVVADADSLQGSSPAEFRSPGGKTVTLTDPLLKAAMQLLGARWPGSATCVGLAADARAETQAARGNAAPSAEDVESVGCLLLELYSRNLVELRRRAPRCAAEPSARPLASPLVRLQATEGAIVTNLRHQRVALSEVDRHVVRRLDGRQGRMELANALEDLSTDASVLAATTTASSQSRRALVEELIEQSLHRAARCGLLMPESESDANG